MALLSLQICKQNLLRHHLQLILDQQMLAPLGKISYLLSMRKPRFSAATRSPATQCSWGRTLLFQPGFHDANPQKRALFSILRSILPHIFACTNLIKVPSHFLKCQLFKQMRIYVKSISHYCPHAFSQESGSTVTSVFPKLERASLPVQDSLPLCSCKCHHFNEKLLKSLELTTNENSRIVDGLPERLQDGKVPERERNGEFSQKMEGIHLCLTQHKGHFTLVPLKDSSVDR